MVVTNDILITLNIFLLSKRENRQEVFAKNHHFA